MLLLVFSLTYWFVLFQISGVGSIIGRACSTFARAESKSVSRVAATVAMQTLSLLDTPA